MTALIVPQRNEVKVWNLWNGVSNDPVPAFAQDKNFDDSAWPYATAEPLAQAGSVVRRVLNGVSQSPGISIANPSDYFGRLLWPTASPTNVRQGAVIRWKFNPGPGPFTNTEVLWQVPSASSGANVRLYLNATYDADGVESGSTFVLQPNVTNQPNENGFPQGTGASVVASPAGLIPNATNVLVMVISPLASPFPAAWGDFAWVTVGFQAFDAPDAPLWTFNYEYQPMRAVDVRCLRWTTPGEVSDASVPGWTTDLSFDDSAWTPGVIADTHGCDPDSQWGTGAGPTPDPVWDNPDETDPNVLILMRWRMFMPGDASTDSTGPGSPAPLALLSPGGWAETGLLAFNIWVNGFGGGWWAGMRPGEINLVALVMPLAYPRGGISTTCGTWVMSSFRFGNRVALPSTPTITRRGRSYAQIIGD